MPLHLSSATHQVYTSIEPWSLINRQEESSQLQRDEVMSRFNKKKTKKENRKKIRRKRKQKSKHNFSLSKYIVREMAY